MKPLFKKYCNTKQARIVTALVLTGILSVGNGLTVIKSATAASTNLFPANKNEVLKGDTRTNRLPRQVASAILRDLSSREQIPSRELEIIDYNQQTWRNGCLDLPKLNEICTQALVSGWRVVLFDGNQKWIYHTNSNGRSLRLANSDTWTSNLPENLPNSVKNAVLKAASRRLDLPTNRLTIIQAQQQTWREGCLDLSSSLENCVQRLTPGWRVIVGAPEQTLVYHTNERGSTLRLNQKASEISESRLPAKVNDAVLKAASQFTGLATSQFRIVNFEQIVTDGCLSLPRPREACTEIALKAWKVTVISSKHRLVFHAHPNSREVRLNEAASRTGTSNANLPKDIATKILADASDKSRLPVSRLQIVELEQRQWPDSCLGISDPLALCAAVIVPGWQVTVSDGEQRWVYRASESGVIAFDQKASMIADSTLKPVPISISELPPPLSRGMIFRQITSGGFSGRTYETVLLNDGRLIRVRIGDANDSERSVRRIKMQQVRKFQQLLEKEGFGEFQNLSYPALRGAADYITYTLTSSDGTVQYNDISQNSLPENLRVVIKTWNQISTSDQ